MEIRGLRARRDRRGEFLVRGGTGGRAPQRVARNPAIIALAFSCLMAGPTGTARGQEQSAGAPQAHVTDRVVRVVEQSPRIGTTGTTVTLRVSRMPALTPVQIVIGATRSGFEGLAIAQTDIDGELLASVEVPDWSENDRPHRFIVFNLYFSTVLAESGIFHVTDADGKVVREGTLGMSGPDCTTLEGDDGERYRLIGSTENARAGDRVVVEGSLRETDQGCGEGLSLELSLDAIR